jgi:hypothetical protein
VLVETRGPRSTRASGGSLLAAVAIAAIAPRDAGAGPPRAAPAPAPVAAAPAKSAPPTPASDEAISAGRPGAKKAVIAGFRMEGDPSIETVFGDTEGYKRHVDRFFALHEQMRESRAQFGRSVRATVTTLAAHKRGKCPEDAVAPLYTRAYREGQSYRELGAELEARHAAIRQLDELGETSGLTPDYRWKVNRVRGMYRDALVDYREMRAVFDDQLASEIRFKSCDADKLLAAGAAALARAPQPDATAAAPASLAPTPIVPTATASVGALAGKPGKRLPDPVAPVMAATFVVDNESCPSTLEVYVDGQLLGEVSARAKAAFQAPAGRHAMCLIPSTSTAACGDAGTVRTAYVHDGWSISLRCN